VTLPPGLTQPFILQFFAASCGEMPSFDYKKFDEMDDLYRITGTMESEASFCYGYPLGAMLMIEVFTEKDELMRSSDL
jgi:hypothetical protein